VFKSMFEAPEVNKAYEQDGSNDHRPIFLKDEAEDIRALFWALSLLLVITALHHLNELALTLHFRPHEVTAMLQESARSTTCYKLLRVSQTAHKYQFDHLDRSGLFYWEGVCN